MKSAFIAIVGRPSAGKSTLLNALLKEKVSIVSKSPQTTRNKIRGILTEDRGQIVFVDTPGYHESEKKFNLYMMELVDSTLVEDSEVILYVIDPTRPPGREESQLVSMLKSKDLPMVTAINKMDLVGEKGLETKDWLISQGIKENIIPVSAKDAKGMKELKDALFEAAPEGELLYPPEYYTDQTPEFRITEIIREETINRLSQELPHAIYIEVSDLEIDEEKNQMWIRAFIQVEKESQKGIVVGRGGKMIRAIRQSSQKSLGKIFTQRIQLDLRVKVNPKWRRKDNLLKDLLQ